MGERHAELGDLSLSSTDGLKASTPSAPEDDSAKPLGLKATARLFLRTWPYLRPQLVHLVALVASTLLIEVIFVLAALVTFDLFNNKILVGQKLEPAQATLLFLDQSFVRSQAQIDADAAAGEDEDGFGDDDAQSDAPQAAPEATIEQRKTIRNRLFIMFALVGLVTFSLSPLTEYYRTWILQRVNQYLRITMVERAEHLSLRYHTHARTGDAIYRVYQDSAMITTVIDNLVVGPITAGSQVAFSFFVIWVFSPTLGVLFLFGMVPIVWFVAWYTPRLQLRSRRARATNSDLTSRIQEAFAAIRVFKANRAEATMARRFDQDSDNAIDAAFALRLDMALMRTGVMIMATLILIATQYLMADWTIANDPTYLAGAVALVGFASWNLGAWQSADSRSAEFLENGRYLVFLWAIVQDMAVGLDRAFYLLDLEPDIVDADDAVGVPSPIEKIQYTGVRFSYDEDVPVLNGVDLTADAGTITAIVGDTGSGKSTLTSLLLRLYDPDAGSISINGTDIRQIRVDDLRANVAIALQQNVLFANTIAENISYATNASRQAIEAAARVACADEFIRAMDKGYDTELGERGGKLSTGQRQRLSIARAIVRDTPILILDEPTASLDAETEHSVLANLNEWGRERVVFLITHRLSTIKSADQIAFLEDGVIVELRRPRKADADSRWQVQAFRPGRKSQRGPTGGLMSDVSSDRHPR